MAKSKNRVLTIDGQQYLWNRKHVHKKQYVRSPCTEILTVYRADQKTAPLRITFDQDEAGTRWVVGDPHQGMIWNRDASINLNEPGVVTALIREAIVQGWVAAQSKHPYVLNGIELLESGSMQHIIAQSLP